MRDQSGFQNLATTDTLATYALYAAQRYLQLTGYGTWRRQGTLRLPNSRIATTKAFFLEPCITLQGSGTDTEIDNIAVSEPWAGSARALSLGIFTRYDIPRFEGFGVRFQCDDYVAGSLWVNNPTGGSWEVGDAMLIYSAADNGTTPDFPIPDRVTFLVVVGVVGNQLRLDQAYNHDIVDPYIVNYNKIPGRKSDLVVGGQAWRYYCAVRSVVRDVKFSSAEDSALVWDAAYKCDLDDISEIQSDKGYCIGGNALVRSRINFEHGTFGGVRNGIEVAIGSSNSTITFGLVEWNGFEDFASDPFNYGLIHTGERCHDMELEGAIDGGALVIGRGLRTGGFDGTYRIDLTSEGSIQALVACSTDGYGNRVYGTFTGSGADHMLLANGAGMDYVQADFIGTPEVDAVLVNASDCLTMTLSSFNNGVLRFTAAVTGNSITTTSIAGGLDGVSTGNVVDLLS